jgi:hypothetical protein
MTEEVLARAADLAAGAGLLGVGLAAPLDLAEVVEAAAAEAAGGLGVIEDLAVESGFWAMALLEENAACMMTESGFPSV